MKSEETQAPTDVREKYRDLPPARAEELEHRAKFYDKERETASAAGKSVKQLRRGYLGTEETKQALAEIKAAGEDFPRFRIRKTKNGLDLALPDGRLIDASIPVLRHWNIYASRITGTGYHEASAIKRTPGQVLGLNREPNNEHDSNAVAITIGTARHKIGYVAKGKAKWVSGAMDAGEKLVAHATRDGSWLLITTREGWELMNGR